MECTDLYRRQSFESALGLNHGLWLVANRPCLLDFGTLGDPMKCLLLRICRRLASMLVSFFLFHRSEYVGFRLWPGFFLCRRAPQQKLRTSGLVEWNWQGKIIVLWKNPVPVPLCPPQIPHGLTRDGTRASTVGGRRLTAWAMARPLYPGYHFWQGACQPFFYIYRVFWQGWESIRPYVTSQVGELFPSHPGWNGTLWMS
jgi:hypothetical protein